MATEPKIKEQPTRLQVVGWNESLMLNLVRQHGLTEAAELLNEQLQAEIAARKRAEEALVLSEKLASVGRMAAVLAHEINNPLAAVTNILFLAQSSEGVPEEVRSYLEMANGELRRIAHITRQTLGFYREMTASSTFFVEHLFHSIVDLLHSKVVSSRAAIRLQCDPQLQLTALEGELRQVFSNLLRNSLEAIPEGGTVTLRATAVHAVSGHGRPCVRISICDNGFGMSSAALSNLFQPFFTTKGLLGNGLGLWVSKQIIETHGGTIQVRSRTGGTFRGTTFSVVLPIGAS